METVLKESAPEHVEPLKGHSQAFKLNSLRKLTLENHKFDQSKGEFKKLMKFYQFVPKTGTVNECTPAQFFELWMPFVIDFKEIWEKEMNLIRREM